MGDTEEILRVMAQAFGRAPDSERYERDRKDMAMLKVAFPVLGTATGVGG